jgi:hypothetical protein
MTKKPRSIFVRFLEWLFEDDDDADGYPGEPCPMCGGHGNIEAERGPFKDIKVCPACKGWRCGEVSDIHKPAEAATPDLAERLIVHTMACAVGPTDCPTCAMLKEAATEITALKEKIEGLEVALNIEKGFSAAEIDALRAKVKRQDEMRKNQLAYSCDLQRIIEDVCGGKDIRTPETSARFHYDMAVRFRRRAAQEATDEL